MGLSTTDMRIVRAALESVIGTERASGVLFEALEAHGRDAPHDLDELLALVRGPLRSVLVQRVAPEIVEEALRTLEGVLLTDFDAMIEESGEEVLLDIEEDSVPPRRSADETLTFPVDRRPVSVIVVAGTEAFANRLGAALGPAWVAPRTVANARALVSYGRASRPVAIVLIDASDLAPIDAPTLGSALDGFPDTTTRVLWGTELPAGRKMKAQLEGRRRPVVGIDRGDGFAALLDLVSSRRGGSSRPPKRR